jgi:hypothetical protein
MSANWREKLAFEPALPAATLFPAFDPPAAAAVAVVAAGDEVAMEDGERVALGFLESGCEYLKGEDFFVEPRPEAEANKRTREAGEAAVGVASLTNLPSPSADGMDVRIWIMS